MNDLSQNHRKHRCVISLVQIREAIQPKKLIIDSLIALGAPIEVKRKDEFDISDYSDDEIQFTGILVERVFLSGDVTIYEWD